MSQCSVDIDFNEWTEAGPSDHGVWTVAPDGEEVVQSVNGNPTFFVSPADFMNVRITGSIQVDENTTDDDFVGFVFSVVSPTESSSSSNTNIDMWLLDWKSNFQSAADEGFSLIRINDSFDFSVNEDFMPFFWTHGSSEGFEIKDEIFGEGLGWVPGVNHEFELRLETDRVQIFMDGNLIIDRGDCFNVGKFGFYNFSQENVRYSDFTYEIFTDFEAPEQVCVGSSFQPSVFGGDCGVNNEEAAASLISNWFWQFGDGNYSFQSTPTHAYENPGIYNVTLTVTDELGCTAESDQVIMVSELSEITASDVTGCVGEETELTANPLSSNIIGFGWDFNLDGDIDASGNTVNHTFSEIGEQLIQVIGFSNGCNDTLDVLVQISDVPEAAFEYTFLSGRTVQFVNLSMPITGSSWDFGDGLSSNETNPVHTFSGDGIYEITLQATEGNCTAETTTSIEVNYQDLTFLPTAFSPNGDGRNDAFRVLGTDISQMEMCVFNHWGELVFTGTNPAQGWNGQINGKEAQAGNYTYLIQGSKTDGEKISFSGTVALLR